MYIVDVYEYICMYICIYICMCICVYISVNAFKHLTLFFALLL